MGFVSAVSFGLGAILIITGIILLIIGTIFAKQKIDCNEDVSAWIWIMVAIGILLMFIGLLLVLAGAFSAANNRRKKEEKAKGEEIHQYRELCC